MQLRSHFLKTSMASGAASLLCLRAFLPGKGQLGQQLPRGKSCALLFGGSLLPSTLALVPSLAWPTSGVSLVSLSGYRSSSHEICTRRVAGHRSQAPIVPCLRMPVALACSLPALSSKARLFSLGKKSLLKH